MHEKDKMRIGDVAKKIKVKQSIIEDWQKEFDLELACSTDREYLYTQENVAQLQKIKELLYAKEYTKAKAKKYLQKQSIKNGETGSIVPASLVETNSETKITPAQVHLDEKLLEKITTLQKKLLRLQQLL